ncbi:MAG: hypothetical protein LBQ37_02310 [Elusimicrobiota bacterium]|jgi:hypothetical protein|nr:hypothetical protein [Elusimicrobiota bacterium]
MSKKVWIISSVASVLVFAALSFFILSSQYLKNSEFSAVDEFFYAINAGYAFSQNVQLVSGLGFIYDLINGLSFKIIERLDLGMDKIIFIASLIFSFFLIAIWALIRVWTQFKIPFLVLLALVELSGISEFAFFRIFNIDIIWSSFYHSNLWALLLLQMILSAMIFDQKESFKTLKNKDICFLSIIQVLFLYIFFNYKMNFFVVSCALSAIPFMIWPIKKSIRYFLLIVILLIVLNVLTTFIFGYDYIQYISSLKIWFEQRMSHPVVMQIEPHVHSMAILSFFTLCGIMILAQISKSFENGGCQELSIKKRQIQEKVIGSVKNFISLLTFKSAIQNLIFIFIFILIVYILTRSNASTFWRLFFFPLIIGFFVFIKHKYIKPLLLIFCLLYILHFDIIYSRSFIKSNGDGWQEVVYRNVNPRREIRFFAHPQKFHERGQILAQKHGGWFINHDEEDDEAINYFDDILDFYKKVGIKSDDKLIIGTHVNFAPFIVNGTYPDNSLIFHSNGDVGPYLRWREFDGANIFIIPKRERLQYILTPYEAEFYMRQYIAERAKDFEIVYETPYFVFYKRK